MCTFVLGTLPTDAPLERLERGYFRFWKVSVGNIASVLQPGELVGRMTSRHCDCGTALASGGPAGRTSESKRDGMQHKVERFQRKGWSRHRIERWFAQVEADQARRAKVKAELAAQEMRSGVTGYTMLSTTSAFSTSACSWTTTIAGLTTPMVPTRSPCRQRGMCGWLTWMSDFWKTWKRACSSRAAVAMRARSTLRIVFEHVGQELDLKKVLARECLRGQVSCIAETDRECASRGSRWILGLDLASGPAMSLPTTWNHPPYWW